MYVRTVDSTRYLINIWEGERGKNETLFCIILLAATQKLMEI